ncbi:unnamed protein product [Didymodactylos carnosus]|uniref:U-box domain-containing protein n=1 Tax=Didymodactylos carnosus TaxID=1234261 RepID=A0A815DUL5_9BILA|nr:unnamed protein product [Didymodactylos carnosus]CAF1382068.1 unnamed protein product [Didymodactylos carnosus]CAF4117005.1 unnamed protein product [Didymodactylos carnosus]CAF4190531.1 unnamed protein product [Didymodactylos carnosus]
MDLPVILIEDGRSYEKRELQQWLQNNNTSPVTNKVLKSKDFIVNITLKNAIEEFREKQVKAQYCEKISNTLVVKSGGLPQQLRDDERYPQLHIKICVFGDRNVGKTTTVKHLQFQERISKEIYATTVGPDLITLHLDRLFEERYAVLINVFDIPGDFRHADMWQNHYRCHGAILMCDVTKPETLKSLANAWFPTLKDRGFNKFESVILCNKIDLAQDSEDQIFKDAERFSTKNDLSLFYTSALTGENVQTMFNQLILCILNNTILFNQLKENIVVSKRTSNKNEPSILLDTKNIILSEKTKGKKKAEKKSSCC